MKKILALFLTIIITVNTATIPVASTTPEKVSLTCEGNEISSEVDPVIKYYNNNTEKIPSIIKSVLSANTTDFTIKNSSIKNYTIQTNSNLEITNIDTEKPTNPDVIIYTDKSVICEVTRSDNPLNTFQSAYENGYIEIEGQGVINSARVFAIDLINSLVGSLI